MATVLKFGFSVIGKTREEVVEELDSQVREVMERMTGEPWVTTMDDVKKVLVGHNITDPDAFICIGNREVLFAGPTALKDNSYHDGFRPQDGTNDPFSF